MSQLLDEEQLESLVYERSKMWSNFLKRCEQNGDGIELELDSIEQFYVDEDDIIDGDEAEEEHVEEDINNASACMSKSELTIMLCSDDNKDIVNQTLPIMEEHVRKWKEAGLDRILNTFDEQKIEQHVGGWMRRHNSAYGDKTLLEMASPIKRHKPLTNNSCTSSSSETESMHSVDTARYIRDSRKRTVSSMSSKVSSSRSPMTTIKMYRTLPKIRDELRAKYDCDEEQEHRRHMQALLHRRDRRKRERELMYYGSRHSPYKKAIGSSSAQPSRRKQLRKRRDNSPMCNSSNSCTSSSEDEYTPGGCNCNACVRLAFSKTTTHPYCAFRSYHSRTHTRSNRHRRHHHSHQHVEVDTRFTHSMMHFKHNACKLQQNLAFEENLRSRIPENDCNCCNKERLGSKVLHIANSSTEEWIVENNIRQDKILQLDPAPTTKIVKPKQQISMETSEEKEDEADKELPTTSQKQTKALVTFSTEEIATGKVATKSILKATPTKITTKLRSQPKVELSAATPSLEVKKTPVKSKTTTKETFAKPKPPKSVKKQPDNKKQTKTKTNKNDNDNKKKKTKNEEEKTDVKKNEKEEKDKEKDEDDFEEQLKLALALSKKLYNTERLRLERQAAVNKPSQDTPQQLPEQSTIFNNQSVACNSTALANDTAKAKQIQKSLTAAVTDLCSPIVNGFIVSDGEADCTVVTSTTGCEVAPPSTPAAAPPSDKTAPTPILISDSDSDSPIQRPRLTEKGILLYAPGTDQSQSLQSISSISSAANFTLTEETLTPIIGSRLALKFFKYSMSSRSFDSRYPVYYRPPEKLAILLRSNTESLDLETSSSSEDDIFDDLNRYGEVYTVRKNSDESD